METTVNSTERLAELIAQKRDLLEQFRQLTRQQWDWISSGQTDRLMNVLAAKEELLRRLHQLERQLDPFRGEDPDKRRWASPEARAACQQMAAACAALLDEILLWEQKGTQQMAQLRDQAAAQLQQWQQQAETAQAYHAPPHPQPTGYYLDVASEG
ncbi:MAG: hypothetical protein KatS3mg109_1006 [Pirellulaceae bacterium]|nr:MAG: hypothetical protein KatS3mg109_1006 [Pirellulaceae bacterium]GIW95068.1 MAG: hypothetical protein KatS3mg110_3109 [Pirellulaceae bacterium]